MQCEQPIENIPHTTRQNGVLLCYHYLKKFLNIFPGDNLLVDGGVVVGVAVGGFCSTGVGDVVAGGDAPVADLLPNKGGGCDRTSPELVPFSKLGTFVGLREIPQVQRIRDHAV